jgi:hypothetical protein
MKKNVLPLLAGAAVMILSALLLLIYTSHAQALPSTTATSTAYTLPTSVMLPTTTPNLDTLATSSTPSITIATTTPMTATSSPLSTYAITLPGNSYTPYLTDLMASTTATSSTISWTTTLFSSSNVSYGTTTSYGETATGLSAIDHSVTLSNLSPGTTYHFSASSQGAQGSMVTPDETFTTPAAPTGEAPLISQLQAIPTYSIATIIWTTDVPATSEVLWGPSLGTYTASATPLSTFAPALTTTHMVSITGLLPQTTYHFIVVSEDAGGDIATSTDQVVTTTPGM